MSFGDAAVGAKVPLLLFLDLDLLRAFEREMKSEGRGRSVFRLVVGWKKLWFLLLAVEGHM